MDYQKFITQLPQLYNNWQESTITPKSSQFQTILDQIQGMTTANVLQLLNLAVNCLEGDEIYCEIGCFQGSTLIGALMNNPEKIAYAVDNFSEFDPKGENIEKLSSNLTSFNLEEQVIFCNQDFEQFFWEFKEIEITNKIGVYLYDGAHDYRSQLLGLMLVKPFLADQALIIVDDTNWNMVQQANWDFLVTHPQCQLLLDLPTPSNGHHTFWNGIQVFSWDVNQSNNYDWLLINEKHRNQSAIRSIYQLHFDLEINQKY